MATLLELCKIKHHAVRSDGAKFIDGERNDSLNTSWLTVNSSGRVTLGPGLYDELLVVKGEVSDDQIKAWASMGAPFYDPTPIVQDGQIPGSARWDQKVRTFYQSSPPTASAVGDLWFDTSDNDKPRRWDGQNWVDASDKSPIPDERIPSAESWSKKNRTYYQDTPPTGTHSLGDVWFNTAEHNKRHWWDGSKWVDAEDVSPIDASQRPVTARGLGGDIEMDKDGMRFIRKADGKVTLQMDIETGSAYFKGDITGASGTFSGRIEAEEGYFRGDITGATGTFAGDLSAEGVVSYGNLNINYARVTSIVIPAPGWNHASLQIAQNKDEWNTGSWLGTFTWDETTSAPKIYTQTITITHQELSTLIGGGIIQYSPDGVNWSSEILLEALSFETPSVFLNVGGHPLAVGLISSSMSSHPSITTSQLRIRVFHLYGTEIDPPESFHIRVKRHAIG